MIQAYLCRGVFDHLRRHCIRLLGKLRRSQWRLRSQGEEKKHPEDRLFANRSWNLCWVCHRVTLVQHSRDISLESWEIPALICCLSLALITSICSIIVLLFTLLAVLLQTSSTNDPYTAHVVSSSAFDLRNPLLLRYSYQPIFASSEWLFPSVASHSGKWGLFEAKKLKNGNSYRC